VVADNDELRVGFIVWETWVRWDREGKRKGKKRQGPIMARVGVTYQTGEEEEEEEGTLIPTREKGMDPRDVLAIAARVLLSRSVGTQSIHLLLVTAH
jgi:hypothetical protein